VRLRLRRDPSSATCTLGSLYVDDALYCFTLEDPVRAGPKIPGETAIPTGAYTVIVTESARFKRRLPLVCGVPGFSGIRIHPGNAAVDTKGCILVGFSRGPARVNHSRVAFERLFGEIEAALAAGDPVTLTIEDARPFVAANPTAP
jgi:hypothetical protein